MKVRISRTLLSSTSAEDKFAIDLFVYRIQLAIGRLTPALQGLEGLVFTVGIGSNSAVIGKFKGLGWLRIDIETNKNQANQYCISNEKSKVKVFVIPTNEEKVIAEEVVKLL